METAILSGAKVCGLQANREGFLQRFPAVSSLHVSVRNADAALAGMDSGICEVAVVTADEWGLRSKLKSNCDKLMHVGVLFEKENAYAVRSDLQAPISWAMTKMLNRGAYASARSIAQNLYVHSIISECDVNDYAGNSLEDSSSMGNGEQDFFVIGPVYFTAIVITVAMLWFVVTDVWRHRQVVLAADTSNYKAVTEKLLNPPSLWKRISCQQMSQSEQDHRGALQTAGNSSDIKIIASMLKSRQITKARTCDVMKPDSPLSIVDVPMLIELMKEAANENANEHDHSQSVSEVIAGDVGLTGQKSFGVAMNVLKFKRKMSSKSKDSSERREDEPTMSSGTKNDKEMRTPSHDEAISPSPADLPVRHPSVRRPSSGV